MKYHFVDNKFVDSHKATIPISDIAFQRGYAVFDFIRTFNGKPFLLDEHLRRFEQSAKNLGLRIPYSRKKIVAIIDRLLSKNGFREAIIKTWITGGDLQGSLEFQPSKGRFIITINDLHELPKRFVKDGIKLLTTEFLRGIPKTKTIDYAKAVKEQIRCKKAGALEVLYIYQGIVIETATSNFFIVKGRTVITPKRNILVGITRNFVLKIAHKKYKVIERDIKLSELWQADEAFITSTKKDILPVVKIDNQKISKGVPGPVTQDLIKRYFKFVHKYYGPSRTR